jgi:hypothetical protein
VGVADPAGNGCGAPAGRCIGGRAAWVRRPDAHLRPLALRRRLAAVLPFDDTNFFFRPSRVCCKSGLIEDATGKVWLSDCGGTVASIAARHGTASRPGRPREETGCLLAAIAKTATEQAPPPTIGSGRGGHGQVASLKRFDSPRFSERLTEAFPLPSRAVSPPGRNPRPPESLQQALDRGN